MHRLPAILLLASSLIAGPVARTWAQERVSFGVMAGMSQANLTGSDVAGTSWRTGLAGGLFFRIAESNRFVFEPQILYVQKGASFDTAGSTGAIRASLKLAYLEIPLLFKLKFGAPRAAIRPELFVAPALAFKLQCVLRNENAGAGISSTCSEGNLTARSTDLSGIIGAAAQIGNLNLQLRYDRSVLKVFESSGSSARSHAILLTFGVSL